MCLLESELKDIIDAQFKASKVVMVGFNRRFSPLTEELKNAVGNNPMTMLYRINAGVISADNWIQDLEIEVVVFFREVCHFIDYLTYVNGSLPVKVSASALPDADQLNDTLNILIQFQNGSSGVVAYYANGSKSMTKEYLEVFSSGISATINDFKELKIFANGKTRKIKFLIKIKDKKKW